MIYTAITLLQGDGLRIVCTEMEGWIKLHRKFLEWEWFDKDNMVRLFIYLLLNANHKTQKWRGETINKGQVLTGRKKLSTDLKVSEQKIRTCLSYLKKTGEITSKSTSKYSIITLCNYDTYQTLNTDINQQPNQQSTSNQPALNQHLTTNKNDKKDKKEKNDKKKNKYAEFVFLTEEEYKKLVAVHGGFWTGKMIEKLDNHKGASGKIYKSDYRAILSWVVDSIKNSPDYARWKTKQMKEEAKKRALSQGNALDKLRDRIPEIDDINKMKEDESLV